MFGFTGVYFANETTGEAIPVGPDTTQSLEPWEDEITLECSLPEGYEDIFFPKSEENPRFDMSFKEMRMLPKRRHKQHRIQKKWLKRYGTKPVWYQWEFADCEGVETKSGEYEVRPRGRISCKRTEEKAGE